jgi:hypothetical protein
MATVPIANADPSHRTLLRLRDDEETLCARGVPRACIIWTSERGPWFNSWEWMAFAKDAREQMARDPETAFFCLDGRDTEKLETLFKDTIEADLEKWTKFKEDMTRFDDAHKRTHQDLYPVAASPPVDYPPISMAPDELPLLGNRTIHHQTDLYVLGSQLHVGDEVIPLDAKCIKVSSQAIYRLFKRIGDENPLRDKTHDSDRQRRLLAFMDALTAMVAETWAKDLPEVAAAHPGGRLKILAEERWIRRGKGYFLTHGFMTQPLAAAIPNLNVSALAQETVAHPPFGANLEEAAAIQAPNN